MKKRPKVALLYGGRSVEQQISIITALQAFEAIDSMRWDPSLVYMAPCGSWYTGQALAERTIYKDFAKAKKALKSVWLPPDPSIRGLIDKEQRAFYPIDIALMAFHGGLGENGAVQGLLELAQIPYTSCGVAASAIAMDKLLCKRILRDASIRSLPELAVNLEQLRLCYPAIEEGITSLFGKDPYPLLIKPRHLGSSVGISIVKESWQLRKALCHTLQYDDEALIEPFLKQKLDLNIALFKTKKQLRTSLIEMPLSASGELLTFEDKYLNKSSDSKGKACRGMASLTRVVNPSEVQPKVKEEIRLLAQKAYETLGCHGVVRMDFLFDLKDNTLYFNELNPLPGSLSYYLWQEGEQPLLYTELLDLLLEEALDRSSRPLNVTFEAPLQAL